MIEQLVRMKRGTAAELSPSEAAFAERTIQDGLLTEYAVAEIFVCGEIRHIVYRGKDKSKRHQRAGRPKVYDWPSCEIGKILDFYEPEKFNSIRAGVSRYAKKSGRKFQTKQVGSKLRVRRIE